MRRSHKNAGPTYNTWSSMKQRCLNPLHPRYSDYGGRGIALCLYWFEFVGFLEDMGERPKDTWLDRIDNDKGYNKENCRWVSVTASNINRRLFKNNSSGHRGVSWNNKTQAWYAYIQIEGARIGLGYHNTLEDAVSARKAAERAFNWPDPC